MPSPDSNVLKCPVSQIHAKFGRKKLRISLRHEENIPFIHVYIVGGID